jgi:hypothetical protein
MEGAAAKVQDKSKTRRKLLARRTALAKLLEKGSSETIPFSLDVCFLGWEAMPAAGRGKPTGDVVTTVRPSRNRNRATLTNLLTLGKWRISKSQRSREHEHAALFHQRTIT